MLLWLIEVALLGLTFVVVGGLIYELHRRERFGMQTSVPA